LSAFWIIVANSWQQTPAGYRIVETATGRHAELTDFFAALFNPSTIPRFLHAVNAALITGSFFVLGLSALYILRGKHLDFAKLSLKVALVAAAIGAAAQLPIGHMHAVQVATYQPTVLAAFEGLFETQKNAPALLFGIPDVETGTVKAAIEIPSGLSMLVSNGDPDHVVQGLNDFPRDEWPPILITFFSFHLMFYLGMFFLAVTALGVFLLWKKKLYDNKFFLKLAVFSLPLPIITNELGWIAAEVGRQPWIVYQVPGMRTAQAASANVSSGEIIASIVMFTVLYSLLFFCWIYLLRRTLKKGPEALPSPTKEVAP
jgi:cytochrome d ubiquinol oxidase subunit I